MHNRSKRDRNLLSAFIAAAIFISSCIPVMGGETANIWDPAYDIGSDDGYSLQEGNITTDTNYYYGAVIITNDGIYDETSTYGVGEESHRISVPGLSYDSACHTLYLDNLSLGCVTDGYLNNKTAGHLFIQCDYQDFTINLTGHNYIGGYSKASRGGMP